MRKGIGISCIILGILCLLIAIGCVFYNHYEASKGEETSQALLQIVQTSIREAVSQESPVQDIPESVVQEMPTLPVGNDSCIGILSIPVLELELPVLTDWSYAKLKTAPCHYYGSCYTTDFVIAAHNYPAHFGRLSQLQAGDLIIFTDAGGTAHCYEVALLETLPPTAIQEMISCGFDLSLYTCTPGGSNRVTVRCTKIND